MTGSSRRFFYWDSFEFLEHILHFNWVGYCFNFFFFINFIIYFNDWELFLNLNWRVLRKWFFHQLQLLRKRKLLLLNVSSLQIKNQILSHLIILRVCLQTQVFTKILKLLPSVILRLQIMQSRKHEIWCGYLNYIKKWIKINDMKYVWFHSVMLLGNLHDWLLAGWNNVYLHFLASATSFNTLNDTANNAQQNDSTNNAKNNYDNTYDAKWCDFWDRLYCNNVTRSV